MDPNNIDGSPAPTHINAFYADLALAEKNLSEAQGAVDAAKAAVIANGGELPDDGETPEVEGAESVDEAPVAPVVDTPAPVVEPTPAPAVDPTPAPTAPDVPVAPAPVADDEVAEGEAPAPTPAA
jgi:hypothetical protein